MTEKEAIAYIADRRWNSSRPGLERIRELLDRMGNPQRRLKYIHVAGSNGKGSTCVMLSEIMRAAGYCTGLFISPYIESFEEQIQVDGACISGEELAQITEKIRAHADAMEDHPSQFEMVTAAAMEYFAYRKCDIVILEVGMGGALDSTNVIDGPEAAVFTNIGLEHTEYLGNTIQEIAEAKAGIIKAGCHVVCYPGDPEAVETIRRISLQAGVPFNLADPDRLQLVEQSRDGQRFRLVRRRCGRNEEEPEDADLSEEYRLSLLGIHQRKNAAVVLETLDVMRARGWDIPETAVKEGLMRVRWPGRMEVFRTHPLFILDGGHNPQCARALAESLEEILDGKRAVFLTGVLADKDYPQMMEILMPCASSFVCIAPKNERALPAAQLAAWLSERGAESCAAADIPEGVELAIKKAGNEGIVVAFGSLYQAGDIRRCADEK